MGIRGGFPVRIPAPGEAVSPLAVPAGPLASSFPSLPFRDAGGRAGFLAIPPAG